MTWKSGPKRILVTGASGGLGGALAQYCASPGTRLSLWGRDEKRLAAIADSCRARGAAADVRSFDLSDAAGAIAALLAEDAADPIDVALLASGLGDTRAAGEIIEDPMLVARLGQVNFVAPSAMAAALAKRMAARGGGSIVLIGSAAAFHALPFAAAYAGSKAGLTRFTQALNLAVSNQGVTVTLASPGFIDTEAARQVSGPKPLIMSPNDAAARIVKAAMRGKAHIVMPWPFALLRLIDRAMPDLLRSRLLRSLTPHGL